MSQIPHQSYNPREDHGPTTSGYTASPRSSGMPPTAHHGTLPYRPNGYWYCDPDDTRAYSRPRRTPRTHPSHVVRGYSQPHGTPPGPYADTHTRFLSTRPDGYCVERTVGYVDPATMVSGWHNTNDPTQVAYDHLLEPETAPGSYDTHMAPPTGTRNLHSANRPPPWIRQTSSQSPDMYAYYPRSEQQAQHEYITAIFDHEDHTCPLSDLRSELARLMELSDGQSKEIRRLMGKIEESITQQVQSESDSEHAWTRFNLLDQVTAADGIIEHKARLIAALQAATAALPTTRETNPTEEKQSQVKVTRGGPQVEECPAGDQRLPEADYDPLNVPHTSSDNTSAYTGEEATSHANTTDSGYFGDPYDTAVPSSSGPRGQRKGKERMR